MVLGLMAGPKEEPQSCVPSQKNMIPGMLVQHLLMWRQLSALRLLLLMALGNLSGGP